MKALKKPSSINLPIWMDRAIRDLAQRHKRSVSGEIEFLIEEAIKKTMPNDYEQIAAPEKEKREAIDV